MKRTVLLIFFFLSLSMMRGQLKFLVEDFEGFSDAHSDIKLNGVFTFGCIKPQLDHSKPVNKNYSGKRALKIEKEGRESFGGWGKGINQFVELHFTQDYFNFYIHTNGNSSCKIELQEDDNADNEYQKEKDDSWIVIENFSGKNSWELVSIPLSSFRDGNPGGDGTFNVNYKHGRLLCIILTFENVSQIPQRQAFYFDFLCFSKGKLPVGGNIFDPVPASQEDHCSLGAWSEEGNSANFTDIAKSFEKNFTPSSKKLGVVHFFQPFSVEGGSGQYHYPSIERINKVIRDGYIPMITLEDHFVNANSTEKQPNLYSIVEGHFDSFFGYWAHHIKQVQGTVILRILHEFNGDWYPWCTIKNDKDPHLVAKAYRYIYNVFKENNVNNVRFIWCPNSMSIPQAEWNYIMDAYPGDDYVDFVALDIYNGAGKGSIWRSFRKEAIENYFTLTQKLPNKPLLVCEVASRERNTFEEGQNKAEWIYQMTEAVKTDMSKIKLLAWFDEKETFKINSSGISKDAFIKCVVQDDYFKSGPKYLYPLIEITK
jgi:beta-mannanase